MINLLRNKPFLELLGTSEPDQQQALLETATAEQVRRNLDLTKMKCLGWQIEGNVEEEKNGYSFNMVTVSLDYY
jgi:hypothetical protein